MKISLQWLQEFFSQETAKGCVAREALALRAALPKAGIEVGGVTRAGDAIRGVVVAQIESFSRHPNADRLNVTQIRVSETSPLLQVVCGASNVRAGMKVALATVGTVLPGELKIKSSKIRDVESHGMLCSESELGLASTSSGILELPVSAPLGASVAQVLGMDDEVWELELTPDRGDCLSYWGVARECARWLQASPVLPEVESADLGDAQVSVAGVEVQAKAAVLSYSAALLDSVVVGASPEWVKRRLERVGLRSHNNVVDVTNVVLLEMGLPMHAFDADAVVGSKLIVRFAKTGEKLKTLDGVERILGNEDLVIADVEKPLALAGVMGGLESSVTEKTKRVLLEVAVFDPDVIRATAARHRLHSDSSHRFERGVDLSMRASARGRALLLLRQWAQARRRGSWSEVVTAAGEKRLAQTHTNVDLRRFQRVVGSEIPVETAASLLKSVGLNAEVKSQNVLRVEMPSHRHDLAREIDWIEEIARLRGLDDIPVRFPKLVEPVVSNSQSLYSLERRLRKTCLELALSEMVPYSFVSDRERSEVPQHATVELSNPLSQDWKFMRPCLSFGLLEVLRRHAALGQLQGSFFDVGHAFEQEQKNSGDVASDKSTGVVERVHVAWAHLGQRQSLHWSQDKKSSERDAHVDFFDGKGTGEALVQAWSVVDPQWKSLRWISLMEISKSPDLHQEFERQASWIPQALLHPGRSAIAVLPGKGLGRVIGFVGELHPGRKSDWLNLPKGLGLGVVVGEFRVFDFDLAKANGLEGLSLVQLPKVQLSRRTPVVERDLALVVSKDLSFELLSRTLRKASAEALLDLQCVDVYALENNKLSIAVRARFQGKDETLTDAAIQAYVQAMLESAKAQHGAELR